jgi:vitamin B12 transporter
VRPISFVLGFMLCVPFLWAQSSPPSTLSGMVTDITKAVLPRVTVRVIDRSGREKARNLTDSTGHFHFDHLLAGPYKIEASLIGFCPKTLEAEAGKDVQLVLEVAPVRENIIVTAARTEVPTSQTGATVTVFNRRDIDDRQPLLASGLLQSVPGVMVVRTGGLGNVTSVFVRGGESKYNKVLVDGLGLAPINTSCKDESKSPKAI